MTSTAGGGLRAARGGACGWAPAARPRPPRRALRRRTPPRRDRARGRPTRRPRAPRFGTTSPARARARAPPRDRLRFRLRLGFGLWLWLFLGDRFGFRLGLRLRFGLRGGFRLWLGCRPADRSGRAGLALAFGLEVVLALEAGELVDVHVELVRDPGVSASLSDPEPDLVQLRAQRGLSADVRGFSFRGAADCRCVKKSARRRRIVCASRPRPSAPVRRNHLISSRGDDA